MQDEAYKAADHAQRGRDLYAWSKYELTTLWLKPFARAGQRLLNIGCGSGEYNSVATGLGLGVIACEPDPAAYELAERTRPAGCEVRPCGVLELDPTRDAADFIVMHDVLEHIEDDRRAAAHLARLLRPGGRMVLSVPALSWLFGRHDELLGHYRRYDRQSLRRVLEPHFSLQTLRYFGVSFIAPCLYYSVLTRKPYPVEQAGSGSSGKLLRVVCELEKRLRPPIGTSLISVVLPKRS
ncbi:MAG TPA: class I SAM-dependent methyltransferase [Polyangiaceae bacterium]|nr:class I SAM-dependent methyltransferase [Polyangiaceae bacterium]